MNHGISAYRHAAAQRLQSVQQVDTPARPRPAEATQTVRELQQARTLAPDLTREESSMIERYFPASEEMSLRIYGPGSGPKNLNPQAVGGRLDMRG